MNRRRATLSILCALGCFGAQGSAAFAQDAVELKPKFDAVKSYKETSTTKLEQTLTINGMDIKTEVNAQDVRALSLLPADSKGNIGIKSKTESRKVDYTLPGINLSYDSSNPNQAKNDNPALQGLIDIQRAMSSVEFIYRIDPKGNVVSAEGGDKVLNEVPEAIRSSAESQLKAETLRKQFAQRNEFVPDKPVKPGDTWTRKTESDLGANQLLTLTIEYKYVGEEKQGGRTLDKIEGTVKAVDFKQEPTPGSPATVEKSNLKAPTSKITILFDREKGMRVEEKSMVPIEGDMTLSVMGQQLEAKLKLTLENSSSVKE